jgi:ABC-2 type transport system permease protein
MLRRIWRLAVKEYIQLKRDRLMALFIFLVPFSQMVLLAQVSGQGVAHLDLAIVDHDLSIHSQDLIQALANVRDLSWRYQPASDDELVSLLDSGKVVVGVVIPAGFERELLRTGGRPMVQVLVDGSNSMVAATAKSYVEGAVAAYGQQLAKRHGLSIVPAIRLDSVLRYNPSMKERPYAIPAQMGFIVYEVTLTMASLSFAREKELGTLEQLLVTPLRPLELVIGKSVMVWIVGSLNFLGMFWLVTAVYDVPMRGSFLVLLAFSLLFVAVEVSYGIILSAFSASQQQAVLYTFMLAITDVGLSGYLVPVRSMPALLRSITNVSPLQHYLAAVRAIMLKGAGLDVLYPRLLAIAAIGMVVGLLATAAATRQSE